VARALVIALRPSGVPVIVNDRADVALAADAAGVHVGTEDVPASALRAVVPPGFIIGASVGSNDEVERATGADYAGIGPVFDTASKADAGPSIGLEGFASLRRRVGLPSVAIGGVTAENARSVIETGANGVAVIRAVFSAADPELAARRIRGASGT
jgi:thiamine-phosphate pyrophosphorylase